MENNAAANESKWTRIMYMILIAVFYNVAELVMFVVAVFQVILVVITGAPNERSRRFGGELAAYAGECWRYLTYDSELKPFPFADWPTVAGSRDSGEGQE